MRFDDLFFAAGIAKTVKTQPRILFRGSLICLRTDYARFFF
jgi:hypothetical protein